MGLLIFVKGFSLSAPAIEMFSNKETCFIWLLVFFQQTVNLVHLFMCFTASGGEKEEGK